MKFALMNLYTNKRVLTTLAPNQITILVGKNGYGKTTFLWSLQEYCKEQKIPYYFYNDNEQGRNNGMQKMLRNENYEGLASMAFHSEGEAMLTAFSYFGLKEIGKRVHQNVGKANTFFILLDQLDSGLDCKQLDEIKRVLRELVIPDINKSGMEAYVFITSNSYELAEGEDCVDPVTGKHYSFSDMVEFKSYIKSLYKK